MGSISRKNYSIEEIRRKNMETEYCLTFEGFSWTQTRTEWKSARRIVLMGTMIKFTVGVLTQALNDILLADKLSNCYTDIQDEQLRGYHRYYQDDMLIGYRKYCRRRRSKRRNGSRK